MQDRRVSEVQGWWNVCQEGFFWVLRVCFQGVNQGCTKDVARISICDCETWCNVELKLDVPHSSNGLYVLSLSITDSKQHRGPADVTVWMLNSC